jgi:predicted transcriptional regulator
MNQMDLRLEAMCDELTRAGELFPVLFTNDYDRMTYVRFIPARQVNEIETDKEDLERELRYHRLGTVHDIQGTWWASRHTAEPGDPMALHYAVNRAIGCVRGEGDLLPVLPWAKRYTAWLKDRVRLNRARVEGGLWDVTIEDETKVEEKRKQYGTSPPEQGSVIVHGPQEKWQALDLKIDSGDAKEDGKVIRLAVATGAGIPLHFMSEGESATKATAAFMGGPTFRHYRSRQEYFCHILCDIISQAYRLSGKRYYSDLRLKVTVTDIEERDNKVMAESAKTIVEALSAMKAQGWVTDEIAISLAFKFAGEILSQEEIKRILEKAPEQESAGEEEEEGENGELSALALPELVTVTGGGSNGPGY